MRRVKSTVLLYFKLIFVITFSLPQTVYICSIIKGVLKNYSTTTEIQTLDHNMI